MAGRGGGLIRVGGLSERGGWLIRENTVCVVVCSGCYVISCCVIYLDDSDVN